MGRWEELRTWKGDLHLCHDESPSTPAFHFTQVKCEVNCYPVHNSYVWAIHSSWLCWFCMVCDLHGMGLSLAWVSRPQGDLEAAVLMTLVTPSKLGFGSPCGSLVLLVTVAWRSKRGSGFNCLTSHMAHKPQTAPYNKQKGIWESDGKGPWKGPAWCVRDVCRAGEFSANINLCSWRSRLVCRDISRA